MFSFPFSFFPVTSFDPIISSQTLFFHVSLFPFHFRSISMMMVMSTSSLFLFFYCSHSFLSLFVLTLFVTFSLSCHFSSSQHEMKAVAFLYPLSSPFSFLFSPPSLRRDVLSCLHVISAIFTLERLGHGGEDT